MRVIEDGCIGCPPELGCLRSACRYKNEIHYYCDQCHNETILYDYDGSELCIDCLADKFEKVEGSY